MVGSDPSLQHQIIQMYHSSPVGGHSEVQATIKRISTILF